MQEKTPIDDNGGRRGGVNKQESADWKKRMRGIEREEGGGGRQANREHIIPIKIGQHMSFKASMCGSRSFEQSERNLIAFLISGIPLNAPNSQ